MDTFARPLASLLAFFYDLVPNYAAAITLFTIAIMIILLPLTLKGTRSMLAMQRLSPEMKRLQDKHKNDRQKLNEEVMALYRDNKINPLGGCLPLLLQIPVFLVLFNVINGLTSGAGQPGYEPNYLDEGSRLFEDLQQHGGEMESFGMNFALSATDPHSPAAAAIPFYLLIVIMVLAQYWQQRQITSRTPASADTPQAAQMRKIQKVFPPIFGVFSVGFPAAMVLYWTVSSLFRVLQQWGMYRFDPVLKHKVEHAKEEAQHFLDEDEAGGRAQKGPAKGGPKGSGKGSSSKSNKKKRKGR